MDFVEICNVYIGKMIIKAAKKIFNSDKICRSYSDLNFGVTFFGTQCMSLGTVSVLFSFSDTNTCCQQKFVHSPSSETYHGKDAWDKEEEFCLNFSYKHYVRCLANFS